MLKATIVVLGRKGKEVVCRKRLVRAGLNTFVCSDSECDSRKVWQAMVSMLNKGVLQKRMGCRTEDRPNTEQKSYSVKTMMRADGQRKRRGASGDSWRRRDLPQASHADRLLTMLSFDLHK